MTTPLNYIKLDDLEAAGRRLETYAVDHGVFATWEIDSQGLSLVGRVGRSEVSYVVSWQQLAAASFDVLKAKEEHMLRALSD